METMGRSVFVNRQYIDGQTTINSTISFFLYLACQLAC